VTSPSPSSLDRRLGPLDASAIVISNVIGVGIFTTPGVVAEMLPTSAAILAVWALGGALAFAGALAYAELAAWRPQAGGEYVYLRESFGGLAAFLTGWTSFVAGFSGAIAFGAVAVAGYLDRFVPGAGSASVIARWGVGPFGVVLSTRALVAIAIIVTLAIIQARGVRPGRVVQNSLTTLTVIALVGFVVAGLIAAPSPQAAAVVSHRAPAATWLLALVPVMFSFTGWNAAVYVAEEVRDPTRNVPIALALGTISVTALYLALNALYLRVLPRDELIGSMTVGELAAGRLFGSAAAAMFAAVAILIILSSLSAWTLAGPRIYFAMARDGVFLPSVARVHSQYRTPAIAILAQTTWSVVLVLSGTFDQLLKYTAFSVILFSALAVLSLFFVRIRGKDTDTFRAWGYPWAPAIFCLVSFAIVVNMIVNDPLPAFAGLGVMAAGVPIYWWTTRSRETAESPGEPREPREPRRTKNTRDTKVTKVKTT
jgi:APA family basic amino acid/polyamine antiporter